MGFFFFFHRENCQPQSCTVTRIPPKTETKKKKFFSTGINYDGTFLSRAPFVGDKTCPFLFFCKGKERKALCWIQHTDLCWRVSKKRRVVITPTTVNLMYRTGIVFRLNCFATKSIASSDVCDECNWSASKQFYFPGVYQ